MIGFLTAEVGLSVLGGILFLFVYRSPNRYRERALSWHIWALAVAGILEAGQVFLLLLHITLPIWFYMLTYLATNLVVYWRIALVFRARRIDGEEGLSMAAWLYGALRTGAQSLWGILVAQAASRGVTLPDWMQNWFVETLVVAGGIAAVTAGVRWLETRKGDGLGARSARWVARVIMLGLSGKQPVYTSPSTDSKPVAVEMTSGVAHPALRE